MKRAATFLRRLRPLRRGSGDERYEEKVQLDQRRVQEQPGERAFRGL
jgi:hypothetical protein